MAVSEQYKMDDAILHWIDEYKKGKTDRTECLRRIKELLPNPHTTATTKASSSPDTIKLIAQSADDVFWTMDLEGNFTYISPSVNKLRGYTVEEAMSQSLLESVCPEYIDQVKSLVEHSLLYIKENGKFPAGIVHIQQPTKEGGRVWVEISVNGLYENDVCIGICGVSRNVDKRKKNENNSSFSAEAFKKLYNTIDEAIYLLNKNGEFIDVNEGAERMYGFKKSEFLGKTPAFVSAEGRNDLQLVSANLKAAYTGKSCHFEFWGKRKDGSIFPKKVSLYPGDYLGDRVIIAIGRDVSEIIETEKRLKTERNLLETIINSAPFCIYVKDKSLRKILTNNVGLPDLGIEDNDMKYKTDYDIFPPELAKEFAKDDNSVINDGKSIINKEEYIYTKHGEKTWLLTSKVPWLDEQGVPKGLVGFGMDITKQKQNEQIQKLLYHVSHEAIKAESLNELLKIFHAELSELIDTKNFFCGLVNDGKGTMYSPFYVDEEDDIEEWEIGNSFSGYTLKISESVLLNEKEINDLIEQEIIIPIGTKPKSWISVPLKINNKAIGILAAQSYTQDEAFTESHLNLLEMLAHEMSFFIYKKRTELELIEAKEKAIESDRLKSTFLANMSHEIRTPMNAIIGFSELLNDDDIEPEERSNYTDIIQQRSLDLLTLKEDILDISKIEAGQIKIIKSPENINEILKTVYASTKLLWINSGKSKVEFELKLCSSDINLVYTDPSRLRQIMTNLLNNAFKFTPSGNICLGCKKENDNYLTIYVEDTGIGISSKDQSHIFERFRQAEQSYGEIAGAGLGLSISKGLVEALGGTMNLESEPGKGSMFSFTLPL